MRQFSDVESTLEPDNFSALLARLTAEAREKNAASTAATSEADPKAQTRRKGKQKGEPANVLPRVLDALVPHLRTLSDYSPFRFSLVTIPVPVSLLTPPLPVLAYGRELMESCLLDAGLKGDLRLDQALADVGPLLGAMRVAHSTYMKLRESGTQQAYIVCSPKKNADSNVPLNPMMNK